ncbi:MazG nucleotide pyrophosphohydrolase domain protein [Novipirellula aureliae]|uniref:MazG nucleotide pyrophosphohydrolase domain protein n=1 Tax=Novipirellula aureliae TaxID=2527966 RepID=A0A5C6E5L7_9BACT|nr:nucleotide pyrophosphohydrolase [Novipirellula aureliae]TWU43824.1 MazG nucleotide pyrophosphohydrolase domain protein [Novipirellula aureliae]
MSLNETTSGNIARLTIQQAQQQVDDWIKTVGVRYFDEMTNLAQLIEEVGEVARILSRTCGEQSSKEGERLGDLGDELADVLFVVICLANQSKIDLSEALIRNLAKKDNRDATRHLNNPKLQ